MQHMLHTMCAERAFKAAHHRLGGIRRERRVAVFAGGAEFEHVMNCRRWVLHRHRVSVEKWIGENINIKTRPGCALSNPMTAPFY